MKLVVHELKADGLTQIVKPTRMMNVEAIRPHLMIFGKPSGSVRIQILSETDDLIAESNAVKLSTTATLNYFHGNVRFDVMALLAEDTNYKISLVSDGLDPYTFNESAYVGWCVGFDRGLYPPTYEPAALINYPLDLEIWSRSDR